MEFSAATKPAPTNRVGMRTPITGRLQSAAAAMALLAVGAAPSGRHQHCDAALIPTGADPAPYRAYGATFCAGNGGSLVWVWGEVMIPGEYYGTPLRWSGVRLDSTHIATACHAFVDSAGNRVVNIVRVGTGDNYLTNEGAVSQVASIRTYPGYTNDGNFYTPDIAIITLASPIPGANAVFAPSSSTAVNSSVHLAGYGRLTFPYVGFNGTYTGDVMGFNSKVVSYVSFNVSDEYYFAVRFGGSASLLPLNAMGSHGDSGGICIDDQGRVVGQMMSGSTGYPEGGVTNCLDWTHPTIQSFIRSSICPADIGSQGGIAGWDGLLDNNDFIVFIDAFFAQSPVADKGQQGGVAGPDGVWDNNDFIVFIDQFFAGCGG